MNYLSHITLNKNDKRECKGEIEQKMYLCLVKYSLADSFKHDSLLIVCCSWDKRGCVAIKKKNYYFNRDEYRKHDIKEKGPFVLSIF